jgi:tripartite-type tricarboxylate transporter receptor subunit TctC
VTPDTEGVAALVNPPDFDLTELTGICQYGLNSWVLLARSDLELEGLDDLADRYADGDLELIGGLPEGSNLHILALIMQQQYGIEWADYVGYDGTGPISQGVLANEVPVGIGSDTGFASAAEDENAEVIAVFASGGSSVFPDVPSVTDQGYGNVDYIGQINRAMAGPPDLSQDIVDTVASATESALETDEAQNWADETGNTIRFEEGEQVEELFEQVQTEIPKNVNLDEITE